MRHRTSQRSIGSSKKIDIMPAATSTFASPKAKNWISNRMQARKFLDLFAGCGGLSLGLSLAGMRGLFAIERDDMAFATFSSNLVRNGSPEECRFEWPAWLEQKAWGVDEFLEQHRGSLEQLRGKVDVIAGGPPCQGFSFAGRRIEDDPRNLLFNKYVEVVEAVQPAALILENVPGMGIAHKRGNMLELEIGSQPRRQSFYEKLAESLDAAGYEVKATLVDAARFGVPQRRSRLIAIGIRKDLSRWLDGGMGRIFRLLEKARSQQLCDLGLGETVSAVEAISDLEIGNRPLVECKDPMSPRGFLEATPGEASTPYQRLMRQGASGMPDSMRLVQHREGVRERFERILKECPKGVRMSDEARLGYGLKKHRIYPMAPSDPAPTITTLPDDVLHYSEPRILTVRESARLQSFPDWFQFKGKFTTGGDRRTRECPRYTQVGNAVPPLLARAIGMTVLQALEEIEVARKELGMSEPYVVAAAE